MLGNFSIRKVRTASGAIAVQVIRYTQGKLIIVRHIGSSHTQAVEYYHGLWHVEQAFRMSKTDFKTRLIFHYVHDAIRAHVLLCFIGLMMGKFLEIKTGLSLRTVRDILWNVQEAHIKDALTGKCIILQTNIKDFNESKLAQVLKPH